MEGGMLTCMLTYTRSRPPLHPFTRVGNLALCALLRAFRLWPPAALREAHLTAVRAFAAVCSPAAACCEQRMRRAAARSEATHC